MQPPWRDIPEPSGITRTCMNLNGPVTDVGRGNGSRANAKHERGTVRIPGHEVVLPRQKR